MTVPKGVWPKWRERAEKAEDELVAAQVLNEHNEYAIREMLKMEKEVDNLKGELARAREANSALCERLEECRQEDDFHREELRTLRETIEAWKLRAEIAEKALMEHQE